MSPGATRGRHPPVIAYEVARESEPGRPPSAHLEAPGTAGSSRGTPSSPAQVLARWLPFRSQTG